MEGAREIFMSAGFDAASMNDIARAAGVSKGTLYAYFDFEGGAVRGADPRGARPPARAQHDVPRRRARSGEGAGDLRPRARGERHPGRRRSRRPASSSPPRRSSRASARPSTRRGRSSACCMLKAAARRLRRRRLADDRRHDARGAPVHRPVHSATCIKRLLFMVVDADPAGRDRRRGRPRRSRCSSRPTARRRAAEDFDRRAALASPCLRAAASI